MTVITIAMCCHAVTSSDEGLHKRRQGLHKRRQQQQHRTISCGQQSQPYLGFVHDIAYNNADTFTHPSPVARSWSPSAHAPMCCSMSYDDLMSLHATFRYTCYFALFFLTSQLHVLQTVCTCAGQCHQHRIGVGPTNWLYDYYLSST